MKSIAYQDQVITWLIKEKGQMSEKLEDASCKVLEASFLEWFNSDRKKSRFPIVMQKKDYSADFDTMTLKNSQSNETYRIIRDCQHYLNMGIVMVVIKNSEGDFLVLQDSKMGDYHFPSAFVYHEDFYQATMELVKTHTKSHVELRGKPLL